MRALTLTRILLVLGILVTSSFHTQAQSLERNVTKAQVEEFLTNFKRPRSGLYESAENKLKRLLDCTQDGGNCKGIRSLVINEILLRQQFREMGEACTSDGNYSLVLYDSPFHGLDHLDARDYGEWQEELLNSGLTFCNPFKHLSCSSISKKCECRPGTVWNPEVDKNKCSAIPGGYCWIPGFPLDKYQSVQLYNPYANYFDSEPIERATCPSEMDADEQSSGQSRCTMSSKLFLNNLCTNQEIRELDENLEDQFSCLPRLNFGDSCNLELQTQLFTTTDAEVKDYKIRVKKLEAIMEAKTPFCDFNLLVMCGNGGKCECIKPTIYNPDKKSCTFKNPQVSCQEEYTFVKMTAKFPGRVGKEVMDGFKIARQRECPLGCSRANFPSGHPVIPIFYFCRPCPTSLDSSDRIQFIGKYCDKDLTLFLEGAPPPALPIDIPEYKKQWEIFVQFNEKAKEFEKLFRLDKNSPCDFEGELDAHRLIHRIKNVEVQGKVFTEKDFQDVMNSMDKIIGQFGEKGLCRYRLNPRGLQENEISDSEPPGNRPLLLCGPTTINSTCYQPNNTDYLEELTKRLSGKIIPTKSISGKCETHPRDVIEYAGDTIGRVTVPRELTPKAYEYLFNTLEGHWIDNSQFCNRTGGYKCTKSADDKSNATGKCEFSKELLEEVEAELEAEKLVKLRLNSKSSHHSVQNLFPTLLFILHIILLN